MFSDEYPDGFGELYDLENDPWEMHNLYADPDYPNVIGELQQELMDWLVTTTRPATMLPTVKKSPHNRHSATIMLSIRTERSIPTRSDKRHIRTTFDGCR